jgi:hypothetical protein
LLPFVFVSDSGTANGGKFHTLNLKTCQYLRKFAVFFYAFGLGFMNKFLWPFSTARFEESGRDGSNMETLVLGGGWT